MRVRPIRRRLAIAFMLVAGFAAGALALGAWLAAREARLDDSVDRALDATRFDLLAAGERLGDSTGPADLDAVVRSLRLRDDVEAVVIAGGRALVSAPTVSRREVPADLRAIVAGGELGWQREGVAGEPYLVTGGPVPGADAEIYLFSPEDRLHADLAQLARILAAGWLVVVAVAGLLGPVLARRALAPVAAAGATARAVAEELVGAPPAAGGDEFARLGASFTDMAEALRAKIAALDEARARERRFTADVAHELRTPLTGLVAEAMLLAGQAGTLPPEPRRLAELLATDVERLRRLVDDLLEISRLDAGADPVRLEPLDLAALVRATAAAHGAAGAVAVEGDARVVADRRRVDRIVANLVENALVHGGGSAAVAISAHAAAATLVVSDSGPGIPADVLPRVFDRFVKADPARAGRGSGLGLAIAREHARALGGDVTAASEPGRGTRFTVRLPSVTEPLHGRDGAVSGVREASALGRHGTEEGR